MHYLYHISIHFYYFVVWCASFYNPKAKLWIEGRKKTFPLLKEKIQKNEKYYWFHCASLGEFEMARPLMEAIKKNKPNIKILLTFFSPSGYEVRKNYEYADVVCYLPLDTVVNAKKFITRVNPQKVFFAKYEIWPSFLSELEERHVKSYLFSAVFHKKHRFFKWWGGYFRKALRCFTKISVQDEHSRQLLESINIESTVSGDTRFDRVAEHAKNVKPDSTVEKFKGNHILVIAGSSWPAEENMLASYINKHDKKVKCIIAPHQVNESHIHEIEKLFHVKTIRYSRTAEEENVQDFDVMIIDNIGMLASVYSYGDIAVIGGGFTGKLHNILEPAAYGLAIFFGPKHERFKEAADLIKAGGAFEFKDAEELSSQLNSLVHDHMKLNDTKVFSRVFVENRKGATEKILIETGILSAEKPK